MKHMKNILAGSLTALIILIGALSSMADSKDGRVGELIKRLDSDKLER